MSHEQHVEEQHGLEPMQYVWIGLALTIITFVELAFSLWIDIGGALIPVLIFLSAIKFAAVVAFFMHLYFEDQLLIRIFVGSFALARRHTDHADQPLLERHHGSAQRRIAKRRSAARRRASRARRRSRAT